MFIIGNKGSFANAIIEEIKNLSKDEKINKYLIEKNSKPGIILYQVYKWLMSKEMINEPIIFIGGETKIEKNMHLMNVTLPFYLFLIASSKKVRFIYLSSLSVFGLPKSQKININSKMSPKDTYGKSKLILDEMIFSNEYKNVSAILPGSIVTKARPNLLLKTYEFRDQSILRFLFKIIPFSGGISIATVQMIANIIYEQVKTPQNSKSKKIICSKLIHLEEVSYFLNLIGIKTKRKSVKPIIKINLPIFLIKTLTALFPYKVKRKIIFFLKPIFYKNNF